MIRMLSVIFCVTTLAVVLIQATSASSNDNSLQQAPSQLSEQPSNGQEKKLRSPKRRRRTGADIEVGINVKLRNNALNGGHKKAHHKKPAVGLPKPPRHEIPPHIHQIAQQIMNAPAAPQTNDSAVSLPVAIRTSPVGPINDSSISNFTAFGTDVPNSISPNAQGSAGASKDDKSMRYQNSHRRVMWANKHRWSGKQQVRGHQTIIKLTIPIFVADQSKDSFTNDRSFKEDQSDSSSSSSSAQNKDVSNEHDSWGMDENSMSSEPNFENPLVLPVQPNSQPATNAVQQLTESLAASMIGENLTHYLNTTSANKLNSSVLASNSSSIPLNVTDVLLVAPPTNAIISAEKDPISAMMPVEGADIVPEAMATVDNSTTIAPPQSTTLESSPATEAVRRTTHMYNFGARKPKAKN